MRRPHCPRALTRSYVHMHTRTHFEHSNMATPPPTLICTAFKASAPIAFVRFTSARLPAFDRASSSVVKLSRFCSVLLHMYRKALSCEDPLPLSAFSFGHPLKLGRWNCRIPSVLSQLISVVISVFLPKIASIGGKLLIDRSRHIHPSFTETLDLSTPNVLSRCIAVMDELILTRIYSIFTMFGDQRPPRSTTSAEVNGPARVNDPC